MRYGYRRPVKNAEAVSKDRAVLVDLVFKDLRRELKVAARTNFLCCGTCGAAELGSSVKGKTAGYVFWHRQDEDSLMSSGGVYLVYGPGDGPDRTHDVRTMALGRAIVKIIQRHGLTVMWDGSPDHRIWVQLGPAPKK